MANLMETFAPPKFCCFEKDYVVFSGTETPVHANYLRVSKSLLTVFSIQIPVRYPQSLETGNAKTLFYDS